jgi:phospholipase/carboxylesterase
MPPTNDVGFIHKFVPAQSGSAHAVTLLLLHGTGGDENDLLPLGSELWPGAALLGVRGKVLENGMPRFFRRFAEGVFDVEDLKSRTEELAHFIDAASKRYDFSTKRLIAVGYSNGANIAAGLILLHPHYLAAAMLFRAMVPFTPDFIRDFSHLSVFIGAGRLDPIVPSGQVEELGAIFASGGADITISWSQGGHELGEDDIRAAKTWLSKETVRKKLAA